MSNATHKLARETEKKGKKASNPMMENLGYVGTCRCGAPLMIYLESRPENLFNVYCTQCGSVSDVRKPKKGDFYETDTAHGYENPIKLLCHMYKTYKGRDITDEEIEKTPFSEAVNEIQGEV